MLHLSMDLKSLSKRKNRMMDKNIKLTFVFLCLFFSTNVFAQNGADFELDEITIADLNEAYDSGKYSAVQVVQLYLNRIEQLNKKGPHLNAVISINPDALAIAAKLDAERKVSGARSLMHGIPVLLKDNIDTIDKMPTTAGSHALIENYAQKDSSLAESLRNSGAIILGKTNLSEWANFRSTNSSSGWSGVGGQTRNAYLLTANTCGSSSGSGVAAAANLATVTIGTETDGSVVCPAAYNGVVGIKPTVGLVSRTGIIPIAATQDTAGPMTRTVADAAILLNSMVSKDNADPWSMKQPALKIDYATHLKKDGLVGKRIGVMTDLFRMHDDLEPLFIQNLAIIKNQGAVLVEGLKFDLPESAGDAESLVLQYEFKHYLNLYLSGTPESVKSRSLEALISFNQEHKAKEMPYFKQEIFITSQQKNALDDDEYLKAIEDSHVVMKKIIDNLMELHDLDLLIMPSRNPANSQDLVNGDLPSGGGTSSYAAVSGYPSITIPMGYIHELPVAMSMIGRAYDEAILIEAAYAFEQATKARHKPKFIEFMH